MHICENNSHFKAFTIENLRNELSEFGTLQEIKTFCKGNEKFAYITYKKSIHVNVAVKHVNKENFDIDLAMKQTPRSFSFKLIDLPSDC